MTTQELVPNCPDCGAPMRKRSNSRGEFYGCSRYPNCKKCLNPVDAAKAIEEIKKMINGAMRVGRVPETTADVRKRAIRKNPTPTSLGDRIAEENRKKKAALAQAKAESEMAPIEKMDGSPEQEEIWKEFLEGKTHLVVQAYAGTGKTFTAVQGCLRTPKTWSIGYLAFNKSIANEAQAKLRAAGCSHVRGCTYHSLGRRICLERWPGTEIDDSKTDEILISIPQPSGLNDETWGQVLQVTEKLVALAKNYLVDPHDWGSISERLEQIAERHGIEAGPNTQIAMTLVPLVLKESIRQAPQRIDLDDMIWLPVVCKLPCPDKFDILIVDEYQDSNICQQEFGMLVCPSGRIMIVGDNFQAMYGFRGADTNAIPRMTDRMKEEKRGVKVLSLTITRRCPRSHVDLAQAIVPELQALPDAPEGEILSLAEPAALQEMKPGDMVLCRVNAKLVSAAYSLIRRGIRPQIRGRDIGEGLIRTIEKLQKRHVKTIPDLIRELQGYRKNETEKLTALGKKGLSRLEALKDKCDCLQEMMQNSDSIVELKSRIESLFGESGVSSEAVLLGSVHRTKGLEANRVFILAPELLPHPMAKQDWEKVQERNCAYVAVTRAKWDKDHPGTLIFCGPIPAIYSKGPVQ